MDESGMRCVMLKDKCYEMEREIGRPQYKCVFALIFLVVNYGSVSAVGQQ